MYIHTIHIHTNIPLFKCTSIFKYSYPMQKYVNLYLYDQLQFAFNSPSDSSSLFINLF